MSFGAFADCRDSAITPGYSRNVHSKLLKQYPFKSADCFFAKGIGLTLFRYITKKTRLTRLLVRLMGLEPIRVTIRPSNVRVCLFRHSRICKAKLFYYMELGFVNPLR